MYFNSYTVLRQKKYKRPMNRSNHRAICFLSAIFNGNISLLYLLYFFSTHKSIYKSKCIGTFVHYLAKTLVLINFYSYNTLFFNGFDNCFWTYRTIVVENSAISDRKIFPVKISYYSVNYIKRHFGLNTQAFLYHCYAKKNNMCSMA